MTEAKSSGPRAEHGRVVGPGFNNRVYALVQKIPRGSVATYGDIAAALGEAKVARHVGWALAALRRESKQSIYHAENVPWHRVVNARGTISIGGNPLRPPEQALRLREDGVEVNAQNKMELKKYRLRSIGE